MARLSKCIPSMAGFDSHQRKKHDGGNEGQMGSDEAHLSNTSALSADSEHVWV